MFDVATAKMRPWMWWLVVSLTIAASAFHLRRSFVGSFFVDGETRSPSMMRDETVSSGAPQRAHRVRIVLIDGLSLAAATALPELGRFCSSGLDLVSDNGFPTVSLPIQHVLWTGTTQQDSGIQYRISPLAQPPEHALPYRVPGSIAVAESHGEIVSSFGFADVRMRIADDPSWSQDGFLAASLSAVQDRARLVFVHILRVDEAGHRHGSASAEYSEAAAWSDAFLRRLLDATVDANDMAWLVLSDHGHLPTGGHGGAEPTIRRVRACLVAPGLSRETLPSGRMLHLVDLSRVIHDLLGVPMSAAGSGRDLTTALSDPRPDATLPRPVPWRFFMAVFIAVMGLWAGWRFAGKFGLPGWLLVGWAVLVGSHGVPSMSQPMVYAPLGRDVLVMFSPALAILLVTTVRSIRAVGLARSVAGVFSFPIALTFAGYILCFGRPPLVPIWTAQTSVMLVVVQGAALALSLSILWEVPRRDRRDRRDRPDRRNPTPPAPLRR